MMYEVETTDQAETDLREIYECIAFELLASDHASGQLDRLEAHIERLGEFPEKFRRYEKESWNGRSIRCCKQDTEKATEVYGICQSSICLFCIKRWQYDEKAITGATERSPQMDKRKK